VPLLKERITPLHGWDGRTLVAIYLFNAGPERRRLGMVVQRARADRAVGVTLLMQKMSTEDIRRAP
jgi:hypothetical protein